MEPVLGKPYAACPDTHGIPTYWPVPNVGVIPMNAFVVRAAEPVLVDTGTGALSDQFLDALRSISTYRRSAAASAGCSTRSAPLRPPTPSPA